MQRHMANRDNFLIMIVFSFCSTYTPMAIQDFKWDGKYLCVKNGKKMKIVILSAQADWLEIAQVWVNLKDPVNTLPKSCLLRRPVGRRTANIRFTFIITIIHGLMFCEE